MFIRGYDDKGDIRNTRVGKWSLIFQMCGSFDVGILVIKDY